jgi:DNA-directed RNA polymerase III subunit RPC3
MGKVTAQIYGQFLKRLEPRILRCRDNVGEEEDMLEDFSPKKSKNLEHHPLCVTRGILTLVPEIKLSCLELSRGLPDDIELEGSIAVPPKEAKSKARKRSYEDSEDEAPRKNGSKTNGKGCHDEGEGEESEGTDEWAEEDDIDPEANRKKKRMKLIKQHLQLLAEDSYKFLHSEGNRGMGEWSVNYKELGKIMRDIELEKIVEERFEGVGTRLLRIIKDKGKLDEKQVIIRIQVSRTSFLTVIEIATIALIKQNQIRATLSGLHECGHLELQEVPKSQPPQVSRTYFLWYFDAQRANSLLLSDVYKAMSRNIQRTSVEKEKRRHLIEKSERSDVQANYEEYMGTTEKRELDIWRNREERLLVQLMRLDRIVMILRDY